MGGRQICILNLCTDKQASDPSGPVRDLYFAAGGRAETGLIEEELLQDLNEFGVARGLTNGLLVKAHTVLEWDRESQTWSLGGKFPAISVEAASLDRALAEARITEAPHEAEPVPDAPFFVTVSHSGFRRLHVSRACAVRQERCLEWTPLQQVTAECADAVCKLCKPRLDSLEDISSNSASSDSAQELQSS